MLNTIMPSVSVIALLVFLYTVPRCCSIKLTHRMVGGRSVNIGESPYQVSLQSIFDWKHFGCGSVIDARHVITAAHCIYKLSVRVVGIAAGIVRLSDPAQKRYILDHMFIHKDFKPGLMTDDIAILKISGNFQLQKYRIEPISLPSHPIPAGSPVKAYGWGVSSKDPERQPENLQLVDLITINHVDCAIQYKNDTQHSMNVSKGMMCAGAVSGEHYACSGDGGGSLVSYDQNLVGITSWGSDGCAAPNLPGIFIDVFYYRNWIQEILIYSRNSSRPAYTAPVLPQLSLLVLYYILYGT